MGWKGLGLQLSLDQFMQQSYFDGKNEFTGNQIKTLPGFITEFAAASSSSCPSSDPTKREGKKESN